MGNPFLDFVPDDIAIPPSESAAEPAGNPFLEHTPDDIAAEQENIITDPYPRDTVGLQLNPRRSRWDNDEFMAQVLSDIKDQKDYRIGVSKLAAITGTPTYFVEKHWEDMKRATDLTIDPQKFRKDFFWLNNMVLRNPWMADYVIRKKEITEESRKLQYVLEEGHIWDMLSAQWSWEGLAATIASPVALAALYGVRGMEVAEEAETFAKSDVPIIETPRVLSHTYGEKGFYAPAKYAEQISRGIVSVTELAYYGNRAQSIDSELFKLERELAELEGIVDVSDLPGAESSDTEVEALREEINDLRDKKFVIDKEILDLEPQTAQVYHGVGPIQGAVLEAVSTTPSTAIGLASMGVGGLAGFGIGAAVGGPGGAAVGARIGAYTGGFVSATLLERGTSWIELRHTMGDDGKPVDVDTLAAWNNIAAVTKGLIEVGTDAAFLLRGLGPAGDFLLKGQRTAAMKAAFANRGFYESVKSIGKRWAGVAFGEGMEEFTQEGVDIVAKWAAESQHNKRFMPLDVQASLQQMVHAGMIGAIAGGLIGGSMTPVHVATQLIERSKIKRSGALAKSIETLAGIEGVAEAPAEFTEMIHKMARDLGRPIEGIFMSPVRLQEAVLSRGLDISEVTQKLMGSEGPMLFREALQKAQLAPEGATQATLRVDTESFFKNWASLNLLENFADDITTASDTLTSREEAKRQEAERAELKKTLAELEALDKENGWVPQTEAERTLHDAVDVSLRTAAKKSEAISEEQVDNVVRVRRALARVFSARTGLSEEDVLQHFAMQFLSAPTGSNAAQIEKRIADMQNTIAELEGAPGRERQLDLAKTELDNLKLRRAAMEAQETAEIVADSVQNDALVSAALDDDAMELADRVSDNILNQELEGPGVEDEVVPPQTLEQMHNLQQWETRVRAWMQNNGYSKAGIEKHIQAMRGQMAIFTSLAEVEYTFLPRTEEETVKPNWGPEFVELYDEHGGDLDAIADAIKNVEDKKLQTKLKKGLGKAKKERSVFWPPELDQIWEQAQGNLEEMADLIKEESDEQLRKKMTAAFKDATKKQRGTKNPFGPIRRNVDPIYKLSFDLSAMCRKRLEAGATIALIEKRLNEKRAAKGLEPRSLGPNERLALANLFRIAGKEAPCLYCYVESPRAKAAEFVNIGIATAVGERPIPPLKTKNQPGWSATIRGVAQEAVDELVEMGLSRKDLPSPTYWTDVDAMQDEGLRAEWSKLPRLYRFMQAQIQAAKANSPKQYSEYWGQILNLSEDFIRDMDRYAGFRFFSTSDFQFEHVADIMQAFHDMALRKVRSHAYTKVEEYIDIFGDTNQKIQTSMFATVPAILRETEAGKWAALKRGPDGKATDEVLFSGTRKQVLKKLDEYTPDGGFTEDTWQGMSWDKAAKFREKYSNVGTVFIATSRAQIRWALEQDGTEGKRNIDYIIPFHSSGMQKDFFETLGYVNFTGVQSEKWADPKANEGKEVDKIRMYELGAAEGISNEQLSKNYLALCEERGVKPAFDEFKDHPRFAILKKDYARSDTPFEPVRTHKEDGSDAINMKAVNRVLNRFLEFKRDPSTQPSYPAAMANEPITEQMVDLSDSWDNGGPDPHSVTQAKLNRTPMPISKRYQVIADEAASELGVLEQKGPISSRGYIKATRKGFQRILKIFLKKNADVSTPLHEMAHAYLTMLHDITTLEGPVLEQRELRGKPVYEIRDTFTGKALASFKSGDEAQAYMDQYGPALKPKIPKSIQHDYGAILSWLGVSGWEQITREKHEMFAAGFEKYLMEGNAPSVSLISTFARIGAWLFRIYRGGLDLDVEIDDTLRGVFDRMLATDEEINLMRKAMGIDLPFYATAKQAGLTKKQFAEYERKRESDVNRGALHAYALAMESQQKALTKEWRDALAKNKKLATAEYDRRLDVRAEKFIRKGQMTNEDGTDWNVPLQFDGKLSREVTQSILGKNSPVERSIRAATTKEGGYNPDDVAPMFNFKTGVEMLQAIASLSPRARAIRELAEQMTLDENPELRKKIDELDETVGEALHDVGTTDALLREWRMLNTKIGRGSTQQLALEQYAQRLVGMLSVSELRPADALAKELRYAEESTAAAAKGDFKKAADLKLQQLLNHFKYREILKARNEFAKGKRFMQGLTKKSARARLGKAGIRSVEDPRSAYLDVTDTVIESLGLSSPRTVELPRLGIDGLVQQIEMDGGTITFDPLAIEKLIARARPLKSLSVEEFRDIHNLLKNIVANARKKNRVKDGDRAMDVEEAVELLVEEGEANLPTLSGIESTKAGATPAETVISIGRNWSSWLLRQSTMVNWLGGRDVRSAWHRLILTPLRWAEKVKAELMRDTIKPIVEAFEDIPRSIRMRMMERIDGNALFPDHSAGLIKAPYRRFELLIMALNIGTQGALKKNGQRDGTGNFERLTIGRNITEEQVMNALSLLTLAEWKWVQSVWDASEKLWPLSRDLEMRDSGLAPKKLPLRPFSITTSDGHEFTSRGGYVPAVYDRRGATHVQATLGKNIGDMTDQTFVRPGTSHGHLKGRAQNFADVIALEPELFKRGIAQAAHDIAFREPVRQVARLVLDERIQKVLKDKLGSDRTRTFVEWLRAEGGNTTDGGLVPPAGLTKLRSNAMTAILGHRVKTMLGDFAGAFVAAPRLKKYWASGWSKYYADPTTYQALVNKHSTWIPSAKTELEQAYDSITTKMTTKGNPFAQAARAYKESAWWGFEQVFKFTAYPMWTGAYEMFMAEEKMFPAEAALAADNFCMKYYPAHTTTEKSHIQRDKGLLGFTMIFFGYFNSVYQVNADGIQELQQIWMRTKGHHGQKAWSTAKALPAVAGHLVAFWTTSMVLGELFTGRGPDDDEAKDILGWAKWYSRKLLMGLIGPIPFIGYPIESVLGGKVPTERGAPGVSALFEAFKIFSSDKLWEGDIDAMIKALRATGMLSGIPVSPLDQVDYLLRDEGLRRDLKQGDVPGMVEGLLYGRHKKWSPSNLPSLVSTK